MKHAHPAAHASVAARATRRAAAEPAGPTLRARATPSSPLGSPRLLAQRQTLRASFGAEPVQRVEEEDLLQGKGLALQRAEPEEEEMLQGKDLPVQRVEEEELLQGKGLALQRVAPEEEEMLQGKDLPVQRVDEEELLQGKGLALQRMQEEDAPLQGKGLPAGLRAGVEQLSGTDLSDVRVHRGSDRPAQVGAAAYAQGSDIHLAAGQEQHLPHEAWHVAQQKQGRVQATIQAAGVPVNDNPVLEAEADRMGAQAQAVGQRLVRGRG
jgi:hypothetical protein